jgi:ABC-type transport system involved in multi-copper enzyme maturation permease subunit
MSVAALPLAGSPPSASTRFAAVARLEFGELLRSRWLLFCIVLYATLTALFVGLGHRESDVVAFTGMPRVLLSLSHALVILLPLLALTATGPVISRARRDGTLEMLFSQPVGRDDYLRAVTAVRFLALFLPLLVLMPAVAVLSSVGFGQPVPWTFVLRSVLVCGALLWSFTGIGLLVSVRTTEPDRIQMYLLLIWVSAVALIDFGLVGVMLNWNLPAAAVFALAAINPVETARLALLATAEPTLSTLGPVGYYLSHTLGSGLLSLFGVCWPVAVGTGAWLLTRRRLSRGDVI